MTANFVLRCVKCRERLHARDAVYPVPDGGPWHAACADRRWDDVRRFVEATER